MNRITLELTPYVPAADLFRLVCHEPDCAFLDSSLVGELGRWSIIGLKPYETFIKENDGSFTRNGQPQPGRSFEDSLQDYLRTHRDENHTGLPMVSGAIGYLSYDYGRENMGVPSQEADPEPIPQARVVFYDLLVIEDCREKRVWLSACGVTQPAQALLDRFREQIAQAVRQGFPPVPTGRASRPIEVRPNFEKEE